MIAGLRQKGAADFILRLSEFPNGSLGFALVVGELHGPASRHVRGIDHGMLKKAVFPTQLSRERDVLFLGARLAENHFHRQLIAVRIGAEAILVTRHAYVEMGAGDGDLGQLDALFAVQQLSDDSAARLCEVKSERQFAGRQLKYRAVGARRRAAVRGSGGRRTGGGTGGARTGGGGTGGRRGNAGWGVVRGAPG